MTRLAEFVTGYIDRVVNQRDLSAIDECVAPTYRGSGPDWATNVDELRAFYLAQVRDRPDWHIDVQETVEVGDSVVVRAFAGGTVTVDGAPQHRSLEWLTHYRVTAGLISEINILSFVTH